MRLISLIFILISCPSLFSQVNSIQPIFQTGHQGKINKLIFQESNHHLVSSSDDGKIVVWDLSLGLQRGSIIAHESGLTDFILLSDSLLLSAGNDGRCKLWSVPGLSLLKDFPILDQSINAICQINDSIIAIASEKLSVFNLNQEKIVDVPHSNKGALTSLGYNKETQLLAVSGPQENLIALFSCQSELALTQLLIGNANILKFEKDLLLQINAKGEFKYFDPKIDKRNTYSLREDVHTISDVASSGDQFALATSFGQALILDAKTLHIDQHLNVGNSSLTAISYSSNKKWLATGDFNGQINVFSTNNYPLKYIFKAASAPISCVKVHQEEIVIGYSDGTIRSMNLLTNEIKTNSMQATFLEKREGVNYSIISVDSLVDGSIRFTAARIKRHHAQSSKLASLNKLKCRWNLDDNTIVIEKKVKDQNWNEYVNNLYLSNQRFKLEDLLEVDNSIKDNGQEFYFIKGKNWFYSTVGSTDTIVYEALHHSSIMGIQCIPKRKLVISYAQDGSLKFWNYQGDFIATLYLSAQQSFAYFDSHQYYFTSKELMDKIGFIFQEKLHSFEQFDLYFNRPDKIIDGLNLANAETVNLYKQAHLKRLLRLGVEENSFEFHTNVPQLLVTKKEDLLIGNSTMTFTLEAKDTLEKIVSYSYLINGAEELIQLDTPRHYLKTDLSIELSWGINQLAFSCKNDKGIKSLIHKELVNNETIREKPDLYIVSIGVSDYSDSSYQLNYADKDAEEIAKLFSSNKNYKNVHQRLLLNKFVNQNSIDELDLFLSEAKTNDVIIAFYAGHGVLDTKLNYYLATYDLDFNAPSTNGYKFEDFELLIEKQSCRNKLILIDACHSGEIDKTAIEIDKSQEKTEDNELNFRGAGVNVLQNNSNQIGVLELSKLLFVDFRRSQGTTIISSASGAEYAFEGEQWNNGLFTYVLKKGLKEYKADSNGDKKIILSELQFYLRTEVSQLSQGKQNPLARRENIKNNFIIW